MEQWFPQRLLKHVQLRPSLLPVEPSTQGVDPGANGYFVYLFDFGAFNYKTAPGDPTFSVNSEAVPQGSIFLAALTKSVTLNVNVDTPNSASILETGIPVPEPSTSRHRAKR